MNRPHFHYFSNENQGHSKLLIFKELNSYQNLLVKGFKSLKPWNGSETT